MRADRGPCLDERCIIFKRVKERKPAMSTKKNPIRVFVLSSMAALCVLTFCVVTAQAAPDDTTADAVVGQSNFTSNLANQGGAAGTAGTLNGNRGIFISPTDGRLWVADTSNNRVLSWPSPQSFTNGQPADIVLGQASFTAIDANKGNAGPSETSLSGPRSVCVDSAGRVYVADSSNFRVLRYDPPISSNQAAVQVFGQGGSFTTAVQNNGGTSNTSLSNPDGIAVDQNDNIYVIDRNLHRVLIFNSPAANDTTADFVIGQADFVTSVANFPAGNPANNNLLQPIAGYVDGAGNFYVCDEGNNRVLLFMPPMANTMAASKVFGQPLFTTNGTNQGGRSASSLFGPVGAAIDPITGRLYVADPINMRILEYNDPLTGDTVADRVFGQLGDFTTGVVNKGGVSADSINDVGGVAVDAFGNLYGSDRLNSRLLRYNGPPLDMMNGAGGMNGTTAPEVCGICGLCGAGMTMMMPPLAAGLIYLRRTSRRRR